MQYCAALLLAALLAEAASVQLPDYFPQPCSRNLGKDRLNECIKKNMQDAIPFLAKGEKLLGLESLEPIQVEDIKTNFHREPFEFHASVHDTKVFGVANLIVRAVRSRLADNDMNLDLDITIPKLVIEGNLKMNGRVGNYPYSGKGPYNITFTELKATWGLIGESFEKDGAKYMKLKRFIPEYDVSDMKFFAENLVDGSPAVTSLAVGMLNQFWQPVLRAMKPATNPDLERVMKRIANNVFSSIPYAQLFPTE